MQWENAVYIKRSPRKGVCQESVMADKGKALGGDWGAQQEQTKNLKRHCPDPWSAQKKKILLSVRARGLLFGHRELKRLEVSSTTGLLISPFRGSCAVSGIREWTIIASSAVFVLPARLRGARVTVSNR